MKDSGIEWLGKIPNNREKALFKWGIVHLKTGLNPRDNFKLDKESPNFYVTIKNFKNGELFLDDKCDNMDDEAKEIIHQRSDIKKGDILFASIAKDGQAYLIDNDPTNWDINESVFSIRVKENIFNKKYFYYYIINNSFFKNLMLGATGTTFLSIKQNDILNSYIIIPPISEQQKIADYLDKKCNKIDDTIKNNEKEIELLNEYKQSFIDKAFQSIDNYETVRIKNICYVKGRIGWQGLKAEEFIDEGPYLVTGTDFQDGGINWSTCYHISMDRYNEAKEIQLKEKDLLVTKDGTVGKLAYIEKLPGLTSLNSHLFVVRPLDHNKYDNKYLYRYLQTSDFKKYFHRESSGSIMESLTQETFLNYKLKLPNIKDQFNLVNNLEKSCERIDRLISLRQQIINKLDEYKKSLIYECVTGKKEIK